MLVYTITIASIHAYHVTHDVNALIYVSRAQLDHAITTSSADHGRPSTEPVAASTRAP